MLKRATQTDESARYTPKPAKVISGGVGPLVLLLVSLHGMDRTLQILAVGALLGGPPAIVNALYRARRRREDEKILPSI